MISEHYRKDYTGEFIITKSVWGGGSKQQTREWIPNPIENHHISGRAVCVGSNVDIDRFDFTRLQKHRGGLLGSKKLQTYGTGNLAELMRFDFVVDNDGAVLTQLVESGYCDSNIVYTSPKNCLRYPGKFYFTPYNPPVCKEALAVYLAAFDGHQEVFLLGYHNLVEGTNNNWHNHVEAIFRTYRGTKFVLVGEQRYMYEHWLQHANVEVFDYRKFISYCDV